MADPLSAESTVYKSELWALNTAGRELALKPKNKSITNYSDSMSSLFALRKPEVKSFLVQDTAFKLNSLAKRNKVHFQWTRAHMGTEGNERADHLAKMGAYTVPYTVPVSSENVH